MPLRPPSIPRRAAAALPPTERVRRPIPAREAPLRSSSPVDAAYRVYDEYVDEGRRYAEGQSAWFNDAQRDPSPRRDPDPRALLDLWSALTHAWSTISRQPLPGAAIERVAAQLRALLDELTKLGAQPTSRSDDAPYPVPLARDGRSDDRQSGQWRRWFADDDLPHAPGGIEHPGARTDSAGGALLDDDDDAPGTIEPEDLEPRTHVTGSTKRGR